MKIQNLIHLNKVERVRRYLESGGDPNVTDDFGISLLHRSIHNVKIMELLIDAGADVNSKDLLGRTPLYYAYAYASDSVEAFKLLLSRGADFRVVDLVGRNILHSASNTGNIEVAKILLEAGANINIRTRNSCAETPLYRAVDHNQLDMVKFLLQSGADTNLLYLGGGNILHCIVRINEWRSVTSETIEILKLLLDYHADPELRNSNGYTPLELACSLAGEGSRGLIDVLRSYEEIPTCKGVHDS